MQETGVRDDISTKHCDAEREFELVLGRKRAVPQTQRHKYLRWHWRRGKREQAREIAMAATCHEVGCPIGINDRPISGISPAKTPMAGKVTRGSHRRLK